jgi:hypothetical protein
MKLEPIEGSETSAFRTQTLGNYPKENILHKEHGKSLKSRNIILLCLFLLRVIFQWPHRWLHLWLGTAHLKWMSAGGLVVREQGAVTG